MTKSRVANLNTIGWREWIQLPQLDICNIKAKVDTGARSSSLHAYDIKFIEVDGKEIVKFKVHPIQRNTKIIVETQAPVLERRKVRSSNGKAVLRPVILTNYVIFGNSWPIELTLANRDEMGFRMLLGREAIRNRMLVDSGNSYYNGNPFCNTKKTVKSKKVKKPKK